VKGRGCAESFTEPNPTHLQRRTAPGTVAAQRVRMLLTGLLSVAATAHVDQANGCPW
jgi:hypothetical protein